jgi:hypothetical protein
MNKKGKIANKILGQLVHASKTKLCINQIKKSNSEDKNSATTRISADKDKDKDKDKVRVTPTRSYRRVDEQLLRVAGRERDGAEAHGLDVPHDGLAAADVGRGHRGAVHGLALRGVQLRGDGLVCLCKQRAHRDALGEQVQQARTKSKTHTHNE